MVKEGPCRHCGVTSTPLWRNGPPEKPILCNACGSRWRTKGSLTNYVPLHSREAFDASEVKVPHKITVFFKEKKLRKKNESCRLEGDREMLHSDQYYHKIVEGDTSNRSSSGSAISGSDSCVHFGTTDASEITGSVQSNAWDSLVPSKKTPFLACPKPSSIEKLTKDLYSILHEEQASNMSRTSEDDNLLYESGIPFDSSEIGYGGALIKHPYPKSIEEESEASSFPVDKLKTIKEGYSSSISAPVNSDDKGTSCTKSSVDTMKSAAQVYRNTINRDTIPHEQILMLQDRDSPLGYADLNDASSPKIREGDGTLSKPTFPRTSNLASLKRQRDKQHNCSDIKNPTKSTKRVCRSELTNPPPPSLSANQLESSAVSKVTDDMNQFINHEDRRFSPRRFFGSLPDRNSMLFVADSTEDNLLLDLPSSASFPEAQLLCHPWEQKKMNQNSSTRESGVEQPSSSFSNR